ncbi:hypothetical protein L1887_10624 [Cichorium endivia]|nr:hypothetical protein L1887_10624 [Cichorium endivia]
MGMAARRISIETMSSNHHLTNPTCWVPLLPTTLTLHPHLCGFHAQSSTENTPPTAVNHHIHRNNNTMDRSSLSHSKPISNT